jgi:ABC-type transport system involved in cytochrome bd biosynthesis fused ATPase/permease subunit
LKIKKID